MSNSYKLNAVIFDPSTKIYYGIAHEWVHNYGSDPSGYFWVEEVLPDGTLTFQAFPYALVARWQITISRELRKDLQSDR